MSSTPEKPYVGGQAVIEGVMMRSPRSLAVAVRRPDGSIVVREDAWVSIFERWRFLRWPFFRGGVVLVESLYNGIQALNFSAHESTPEEERTEAEPGSPAVALVMSLLLAFGLFKGVPHLLTVLVGKFGLGQGALGVETFGFHAVDGVFKISIFIAYIAGISMVPEIRRVFEYHGAEHKAINAYESQEKLTVEAAQGVTTFHPRCGTSFILFVLVLSIFLFAAIFPWVPRLFDNEVAHHASMIAVKLPLMFPLSGIAYEINRFAARHPEQWWVQLLVGPGRIMQRLTTREPDDDQLEIALTAMAAALKAEARWQALSRAEALAAKDQQSSEGNVLVFRDFAEASGRFGELGAS